MQERIRILLTEDDKIEQMAFERFIERENLPYDYVITGSVSEARSALAAEHFDVALLDYLLGDGTAFDLFDGAGDTPIVVIMGSGDEEIAVRAMRAGAYDCLVKDPEGNYLKTLGIMAENAIRRKRDEEELRQYREHLEELVQTRTTELTRSNERFQAEIAEWAQTEAALRESEAQFRTLAESSPVGIFLDDAQGNAIYVNDRCAELVGLSPEECLALNWVPSIHPDDRERVTREWARSVEQGTTFHQEYRWVHSDGSVVSTLGLVAPVKGPDGSVIVYVGTLVDLTARKTAEEELRRVNRALRVLSEGNQAVVRATEEPALLQQVCQILVEVGGYRLAWVGFAEQDEAKSVRPVAQAGFEEGYLQTLGITWADTERGRGPTGIAIRSGQPAMARNIPTDPNFAPWRAEATRRGYASSIALPLIAGGQALGALNIYAAELDAFDAEEVKLLAELASDLAFGITTLRTRAERQRAEEALRESEEKYRTLFEQANDAIHLANGNDEILDVNPRMCELMGYSREELLAMRISDLQAPEVRGQAGSVVKGEMARYGNASFEALNFHRDGRRIPIEVSVSRVTGLEGDLFISVVRDITERVQAEEEIRQLSQFQESVIDNANVWLDVLDEKANVTIWNKAAAEISGYSREEVVGHSKIWEWLYPDEEYRNQVVVEAVAIIEKGGEERGSETTIRRKDGQTRIISWNSRNIVNEKGRPMGSIALGRDVTEQKRAEEARMRLSVAIEQTAESVIITDTQGTILYVNPAFERITGYSQAEAVGQTPRILKSGKQDAAFYEELWATISVGQAWRGRFVNQKKDGTSYTVEATITPVRDEKGATVSYVGIQRDVTHELQLEEQYRQAQKMEAVGQLTAGIAHDFNNLLTAVNGFAELAQFQLSPDDPAQELIGRVRDSGRRAADLVRQLLAFARKQILQPRVLDLSDVVAEMEGMLRRVIREDIALEMILTPDLWPVEVDPTQMEQVVVNLAVNARDAMPDGGKLIIETANVTLDEEYVADHLGMQVGEHVLLAISDTGVGMNEEVQAHLFEPFFTTKEMGKGTGLGLATVYGIVKQSGGTIWVYSEEGVGATFKIYLPRAGEAPGPLARPAVGRKIPSGEETILLVEDDAQVRDLARQVLQRQGYTLLVAEEGPEAIRLAASHAGAIHLLLTDVVMPGMSGAALARRLTQIDPELKTLFMSGYTDNTIARHGVLDPGVAFLQKPFTPMALALKVREVLDAP